MRTRLKSYISGLIFLITLIVLSLSVSAQDQTDPMVEAFAEFHYQNNLEFQHKTQLLIDYFKDSQGSLPDDFTSSFSPPETIDPVQCQENLSSSCLNFAFEKNLNELIPKIQSSLNSVDISSSPNITERGATKVQARYNFMQEQFEASIDTIQASLTFYQQLIQAYPMHLAYQKTQDELDILIKNLSELESYVKQYPSKYNNVTTPYCQ